MNPFWYGYAGIAALVALRLGWHIVFRLDAYDWRYNTPGIWINSFLCTLAWPLLLLRPALLLKPGRIFSGDHVIAGVGDGGFSAAMRERDRMVATLPRCSGMVRYRQSGADPSSDSLHAPRESWRGEFLFPSAALEDALVRAQPAGAAWAHWTFWEKKGAILQWLRGRDAASTAPSDVPAALSHFEFLADEMLRSGRGEARCLECGDRAERLEPRDDDGSRPGWSYSRLVCPRGHVLFSVARAYRQ